MRVENVRRYWFAGYVHNLETVTGWYGVLGKKPLDTDNPVSLVAHNCRCTVVFEPKEGPKTWRGERNARIRADYPALRDAEGQTSALATLAERENVSERTVRRVLWE